MAKFDITDYFNLKNVTPSTLQPGNLIQFSYASPTGVHDKMPIILVHEKKSDRVYGINTHYDQSVLDQAMKSIETKILPFLEKEYFKKYPENKKKLNETHQEFHKGLITEDEYKKFMRNYPSRDLETFQAEDFDMNAMRQYRFDRITACSRLVWKT